MHFLVYTNCFSPRVEYIFSVLFPAIGLNDYTITEDKESYANFNGAKLNYSGQPVADGEFRISPVSLLFETGVQKQSVNCFQFNHTKAFFRTSEGDFPFDIFAASFYLISRYEEYLPHKPDMYGRYAHENSLAFAEGFLKVPLVNQWLQFFSTALLDRFPSLRLSPAGFHLLPTYDIDIAWSYRHKGWLRNAGGLINSIVESEWSRISERLNVLFGSQRDPFFSYEWLNELHKKTTVKPLYFFLLAGQAKGYDKNISPSNIAMRRLIKQHSSTYDVGIHPSWQSGDQPKLLIQEKKALETITGNPVTQSRQHYIRMTLPDTYRNLIDIGITEDYSMGYGSINGFRASYSLPHKWYDLQKEETTALTIFPFCYMDANSFYEQHLSCDEALEEMLHYYSVCKDVNALFITIWHNHFLGTDPTFAGWKEVYEAFLVEVGSDLLP